MVKKAADAYQLGVVDRCLALFEETIYQSVFNEPLIYISIVSTSHHDLVKSKVY